MSKDCSIRDFTPADFASVREIYQQGIDTKNATFETSAPDWPEWNAKFLPQPRFVAEIDGQVAGWATLSAVSGRPVYAGVCEVSVYVHREQRGKGVGTALLHSLVDFGDRNNIWTLQAGIFPENTGSLKIHREAGFRDVGRREKIGRMDDVWRDTLLLERRSTIAGQ